MPIITTAGFDPVWFGVIITINMEIGLIHPPVGLNLFVINAIAPDVPTRTVSVGHDSLCALHDAGDRDLVHLPGDRHMAAGPPHGRCQAIDRSVRVRVHASKMNRVPTAEWITLSPIASRARS